MNKIKPFKHEILLLHMPIYSYLRYLKSSIIVSNKVQITQPSSKLYQSTSDQYELTKSQTSHTSEGQLILFRKLEDSLIMRIISPLNSYLWKVLLTQRKSGWCLSMKGFRASLLNFLITRSLSYRYKSFIHCNLINFFNRNRSN